MLGFPLLITLFCEDLLQQFMFFIEGIGSRQKRSPKAPHLPSLLKRPPKKAKSPRSKSQHTPSQRMSKQSDESLLIKSALFQPRSQCKPLCQCPYHRMKRYEELIKQSRSLTTSPQNKKYLLLGKQFHLQNMPTLKTLNKNNKSTLELIRKFRKTEQIYEKQSVILGKKKINRGLDNRNVLFEMILKKRMALLKQKQKAKHLINFIKMKVQQNPNYLVNVRELIFTHLKRVIQEIPLQSILQIDQNDEQNLKLFANLMNCSTKDALEIIKNLKIESQLLQKYLVDKMIAERNEKNKENNGFENQSNVDSILQNLMQEFVQKQMNSQSKNQQKIDDQNRKVSFESNEQNDIEIINKKQLKRANKKIRRSRVSLAISKFSSYQQDGSQLVERTLKDVSFKQNLKKSSDVSDGSFQSVPSNDNPGSQKSQGSNKSSKSFKSSESKQNSFKNQRKEKGDSKQTSQKNLTTIKSIFASSSKLPQSSKSLIKKNQFQKGSRKNDREQKKLKKFNKDLYLKKGNLRKKKKSTKQIKSKKNQFSDSSSFLSDSDEQKINQIIENLEDVNDQQKIEKLYDIVEGKIQNDQQFFENFMEKMDNVLQPQQKQLLKNRHRKNEFDKLLYKLTKQADRYINLIEFEREKMQLKKQDIEHIPSNKKINHKKTISLELDYEKKPSMVDHFNRLHKYEKEEKDFSKKKHQNIVYQLEQKEVGNIKMEVFSTNQDIQNTQHQEQDNVCLKNESHLSQSSQKIDHNKQLYLSEYYDYKTPKDSSILSIKTDCTPIKLRSRSNIQKEIQENNSMFFDKDSHLKILRYLKLKKPQKFEETNKSIRNTIESVTQN